MYFIRCLGGRYFMGFTVLTRAVLVFVTERKNNVDPRLQSQKKVNNIQLQGSSRLKGLRRIGTKFKLQLGHSDLILKNW